MKLISILGMGVLFLSSLVSPIRAQEDNSNPLLEIIEFREVTVEDAARLLSMQTQVNIVPTSDAAKQVVTLLLRKVYLEDAIATMCKTYGLWYQKNNQIYNIFTLAEYQRNIAAYEEEKIEIFTLLYPNAADVARTIESLYGSRVKVRVELGEEDTREELQDRFDRFSVFGGSGSQSSQSSGGSGGGGGSSGGSTSGNRESDDFNPNDLGGRKEKFLGHNEYLQRVKAEGAGFTPQELEALKSDTLDPALKEKFAEWLVYQAKPPIRITVYNRHNKLIIRTADKYAMTQIRELIARLDLPNPLVLIEVKIMLVTLGDGFNSVFDVSFKNGFYSGNFTEGDFGLPTGSSFLPGGSGFQSDSVLFQYVSGSFAARMEFLEDQNRITNLATPLLLTANREVSQIFVGDSVPVVQGLTAGNVVANNNNTVTTQANFDVSQQEVGTSLLITPSINADRTVTLNISQETSEVVRNGARVPVQSPVGFQEQQIDIVRRRNISGTIIAKDGLAVAIGGLIEESVGESIEQVPLLGEIPLIGMLFRRKNTSKERKELVIMLRPYIISTVEDTEQVSKDILNELSLHPLVPTLRGDLRTYNPSDVRDGDAPISDLHMTFDYFFTEEE